MLVNLSEGLHTAAVRAIDVVDHSDPNAVVLSWTIDRTPPETRVIAKHRLPTNSSVILLVLSGHDDLSSVSRWELTHVGPPAVVPATVTAHDNSALVECRDLHEGSHIIEARACDAAGNLATRAAQFVAVVDLTPPTTSAVLTGKSVTSNRTAELRFSGNDATSSIVRWHVTVHLQEVLVQEVVVASPVMVLHNLLEGSWLADVKAEDLAQNTDMTGYQLRWIVDTTPPSTAAHLNVGVLTNLTRVTLHLSGSDHGSGITDWLIAIDGAAQTCQSPAMVVSNLADGTHAIRVQARDKAGNLDLLGVLITFAVDTVPPTCRFSAYPNPLSATHIVSTRTLCDEPCTTTVHVSSGMSRHLTMDETSNWSLVDGVYHFACNAQDAAGNTQFSETVGPQFVIDTTPITLVQLRFVDSPLSRRLLTSTSVVEMEFNLVDANFRPCAQCRIEVLVESSGAHVTTSAVGETGFLSVHVLHDGEWTLSSTATDEAGNQQRGANMTIIRDTVPASCNVQRWSAANNSITNSTEFELVLVSEPGTLFHVSGAISQVLPDRGVAILHLHKLSDGLHRVYIRTEDLAGNMADEMVSWSWSVDTQPPMSHWDVAPAPVASTRVIGGTITEQAGCQTWMFVRSDSSSSESSGRCSAQVCSVQVHEDGVFKVWLKAVDDAGNAEAPDNVTTVLVDSSPPNLTWDLRETPPMRTRVTTWAVTVIVHDLSATRVIAVATQLGSHNARPIIVMPLHNTTGYVLSLSDVKQGLWLVDVRVTDVLGHAAQPWNMTWLVDLEPPTLQSFAPGAPLINATGSLPLYAETGIPLSATCADNNGMCSVAYRYRQEQSFSSGLRCGQGAAESSIAHWVPISSALTGLPDGRYAIDLLLTDAVGNERQLQTLWRFELDTTAPVAPTLEVQGIAAGLQTTSTSFQGTVSIQGDSSPQQAALVLMFSWDSEPSATVEAVLTQTATGEWRHQGLVRITGLGDGPHQFSVWAIDAAKHRGDAQTFLWAVQTAAPNTYLLHAPPTDADLALGFLWVFRVRMEQIGAAAIRGVEIQVDDEQQWRVACTGVMECEVPVKMVTPGLHTFKARAVNVLNLPDDSPAIATWSVKQCTDGQVADVNTVTGTVLCRSCPEGGNCRSGLATTNQVVAQKGYWASAQNQVFYECPLPRACVGGSGNASSPAGCADGYTCVLCSMCLEGYFLQFGECLKCPDSTTTAWFTMIGAGAALAVLAAAAYRWRALLPQTVMKLCLTMLQIIGSANSTFDAPWPDSFVSFITGMKVFMLELLTLTRTSCAVPVSFYFSWQVTVLGMAGVTCVIATGAIIKAYFKKNRSGPFTITLSMLVKPLFMFWLVCYPAVSLKLFQVFNCVDIEGTRLLLADMRLPCNDSVWKVYAGLSGVFMLGFTVGMPSGLALYLWSKQRAGKLSLDSSTRTAGSNRGSKSDHSDSNLAFLFQHYGTHAYAWESVELLRKLILTSGLTMLDAKSPIPLTLAVLVSAFAHVLHAAYKPFVDATYYWLQHASLGVTTLVFTIGLMLKVKGTGSTDSSLYLALAASLLLLCGGLCIAFLVVAVRDMLRGVRILGIIKGKSRSGLVITNSLSARQAGGKLGMPAVPQQRESLPPIIAILESENVPVFHNPLHQHQQTSTVLPQLSSSLLHLPMNENPLHKSKRGFQPTSSSAPVTAAAANRQAGDGMPTGPQVNPLYQSKRSFIPHPQSQRMRVNAPPEDARPHANPLYKSKRSLASRAQSQRTLMNAQPEDARPHANPLYESKRSLPSRAQSQRTLMNAQPEK